MKNIIFKILASLLIVGGVLFLVMGIYPIFEMKQEVAGSLQEWENLKEEVENGSVDSQSETITDATIIGTLKIEKFDSIIPIRIGTTDAILKKGIGLDVQTPLMDVEGNSVLYGHREEIFWNLKDVQLGDKIIVEMLDKTLTYEIIEIKVVDPEDPIIYQATDENWVTLVTCYPFIYMGETPERYIVIASLID